MNYCKRRFIPLEVLITQLSPTGRGYCVIFVTCSIPFDAMDSIPKMDPCD